MGRAAATTFIQRYQPSHQKDVYLFWGIAVAKCAPATIADHNPV
jgi:hypothetical protein